MPNEIHPRLLEMGARPHSEQKEDIVLHISGFWRIDIAHAFFADVDDETGYWSVCIDPMREDGGGCMGFSTMTRKQAQEHLVEWLQEFQDKFRKLRNQKDNLYTQAEAFETRIQALYGIWG